MPVFFTLISTSSGPRTGTGSSRISSPGAGLVFTRARIKISSNNLQFLGGALEGCHRLIDIRWRQGGRHLGADAGLALRNDGVKKSGHIYTFREQTLSELLSQSRFPEHHRNDRMLARQQVEP